MNTGTPNHENVKPDYENILTRALLSDILRFVLNQNGEISWYKMTVVRENLVVSVIILRTNVTF